MRTWHLIPVLCLLLAAPARGEDQAAGEVLRDLELEAWLTSEEIVLPGEPVRLGAKITNRSKTQSYALVRPGDGSESGWREPHVWFTATVRLPEGRDVPVEKKAWGRCGLFDATWHDEVETLGPGEALDLTMHLSPPSTFLDFQREGLTEILVHYAWRGGRAGKGGPNPEPPQDLGPMKGVPPFELVSAPVVLQVRRPVEVSVKVTSTMRVGETRTLADLLQVTIQNRSDEALDFRPQQIQFLVGTTSPSDLLDLREVVEPTARVRAAPIPAGGTRVYKGVSTFRLLRHLRLRGRVPGTLELAAVYAPGATDRGPDRSQVWIRSPWATVGVAPTEK